MGKLTLSLAKKLSGGGNIRHIQRLDASNKSLDEVEDLSPCLELLRLDISHNSITSIDGLVYSTCLTWIDLSHNCLDSLVGLRRLVNLVVLRASHNSIVSCGDLSSFKSLKALILSHNQLSSLQGLSSLKQLNTLVLSHNQFETVSIDKLHQLSKLSLSHNCLRMIPSTEFNLELKELRVNDNKVGNIPESLQFNRKLRILDLGNNRLKNVSVLEPLRSLEQLTNLNLLGNQLSKNEAGYQDEILKLRQSLTILNGKKIGGSQPPVKKSQLKVKKYPNSTVGDKAKDRKERGKAKERTQGKNQMGCEDEAIVEQTAAGFRKRARKDKSEIISVANRVKRKQEYPTGGCDSTPTITSTGKATEICSSEAEEVMPDRKKQKIAQNFESGFQKKLTSDKSKMSLEHKREGNHQALRKELKKSLSKGRGHSGIVAVTDVKRKVKKKKETKWDPSNFSSKAETLQIGSGQTSTWT